MTFREGDNVIVKGTNTSLDGMRATIHTVTPHSPPPYGVTLENNDSRWLHEENLVLDCRCEPISMGCRCGAFQREQEAKTTNLDGFSGNRVN